MLLAAGVDLSAKTSTGITALSLARELGNAAIIRKLER
jgi:hypothetical protein